MGVPKKTPNPQPSEKPPRHLSGLGLGVQGLGRSSCHMHATECSEETPSWEVRVILEGSWYLLTTYNCTYNPTYDTPKGPY